MAKPRGKTYDTLLELQDNDTLTASQVGEVLTVAKILDLHTGGTVGFKMTGNEAVAETPCAMIVDISAMDIASNDELYTFILEGSSSPTFASDINQLAVLNLGPNETLIGATDVDSAIGRYEVPVTNLRGEVPYQYLRLNVIIAGTSPSITIDNVFLAKND